MEILTKKSTKYLTTRRILDVLAIIPGPWLLGDWILILLNVAIFIKSLFSASTISLGFVPNIAREMLLWQLIVKGTAMLQL